MADACLRDGGVRFLGGLPALLADPDLIHKAAEDRLDETRRCIGSLNCLSRLFRDLPYTCTMNPALGHEVEPSTGDAGGGEEEDHDYRRRPAGMECAITAAKRGTRSRVRQGCAHWRQPLRLRHERPGAARRPALVISHYEVVAKRLGIEIRLNTEVHAKFMRSVLHQYDVCVIAAGASADRTHYESVEGAT